MIRIDVSAAFHLRDGYSGRLVPTANPRCTLDGVRLNPIRKEGGYLVFTDLSPGPHSLTICCPGFQDERVDFETEIGRTAERSIALKPAGAYRFPEEVTRLELTLIWKNQPPATPAVWICAPGGPEVKTAQERVEAGERQMRLYRRSPGILLTIPGNFLIQDGDASEICQLQELKSEVGYLAAPLERAHPRGKLLLPAQFYQADDGGRIHAVFHGPGRAELIAQGSSRVQSLDLTEGENTLTITL